MKTKKFLGRDNNLTIIDKNFNENGYLVIKCIFARTGIQERYGFEINSDFEQDKLYKEHRSPEEVFKSEVLEGFKNIVITNDHPKETLTIKNTKFYAVGFVSSTVKIVDNSYLECEITIFDDLTIKDIQNGKKELSAGYTYQLELVQHSNYDYIQKNIKPNHIAVVQAGRCGSACSMSFDKKPKKQRKKMKVKFKKMLPTGTEETVDTIDIKDEKAAKKMQIIADKMFEATKKIKSEDTGDKKTEDLKDTGDKKIKDLKNKIKEKMAEIDKLQAQVDIKPKEIANDTKTIISLATDLASVMLVAKDSGVCSKNKDSLTIKTEIIKKFQPNLDLTGKSSEYIGYAFDNIASQLDEANTSYLKALDLKVGNGLDKLTKKTDKAEKLFNTKFGGE